MRPAYIPAMNPKHESGRHKHKHFLLRRAA